MAARTSKKIKSYPTRFFKRYYYKGNLTLYPKFPKGDLCCFHEENGVHFSRQNNQFLESLNHLVVLSHGDFLTIFKDDAETEILWDGLICKDREASFNKAFMINFVPSNIRYRDWVRWFQEGRRAHVVCSSRIGDFDAEILGAGRGNHRIRSTKK